MINGVNVASNASDAKRQRAKTACIDYENAVAEYGYNSGEAMAARLFMSAAVREYRSAQARRFPAR